MDKTFCMKNLKWILETFCDFYEYQLEELKVDGSCDPDAAYQAAKKILAMFKDEDKYVESC